MTTALIDQIALQEIIGAEAGALLRDDLTAVSAASDLTEDTTVALCLTDPVELIRAVIALDGTVGTLLLLSSSLDAETIEALVAKVGATTLITDRDGLVAAGSARAFDDAVTRGSREKTKTTQWLMTTSGTTGIPKIIPHTLKSLTRSVYRFQPSDAPSWGLLYDPTRFAGLQVVLQALIGGGRLIATDTHGTLKEQLGQLASNGVTFLSATPTLWRRILMTPGHRELPLKQVTLGGETADQSTLDALKSAFPEARVTHIYASTEAGVGFSVKDGKAGFPASYLDLAPGGTKLKIVEGCLWLRPATGAPQKSAEVEVDDAGYVRSGDMIEEAGDRLLFLGRESGLINVGGVKFYPETVEDVLNSLEGVALAQVSTKKSPITGTLVVAEVQAEPETDQAAVKAAILEACREKLVREAVPAVIRFVEGFETNAAGKLVRKGK